MEHHLGTQSMCKSEPFALEIFVIHSGHCVVPALVPYCALFRTIQGNISGMQYIAAQVLFFVDRVRWWKLLVIVELCTLVQNTFTLFPKDVCEFGSLPAHALVEPSCRCLFVGVLKTEYTKSHSVGFVLNVRSISGFLLYPGSYEKWGFDHSNFWRCFTWKS